MPGDSPLQTVIVAASSPPSVVILGTDAVLAARPATAVQLAHACLKAGYRNAIPASWGDELLANEALHHLADPDRAPTAVYCVCPLVVGRLGSIAQDPASNVVALVSPPIATARYVRALAGDTPLHVTYVGGCPDASERDIDARFTPAEFLERLEALGIVPANEPLVFDSILPADRRRYRSLPGGVPSAETLWSEGGARALAELDQPDFVADLAQRFLSRERTLIDVATRLGCVCSGASEQVPPLAARAAVTALEPPRATSSVVDESLDIPLLRRLPRQRTPAFAMTGIAAAPREGAGQREGAAEREASGGAAPEPGAAAASGSGATSAAESDALAGEERAPAAERAAPRGAAARTALPGEPALEIPEAPQPHEAERGGTAGGVPVASSGPEGRALPRAYLLRRRTPRGTRAVPEHPAEPTAPPRSAPLERERSIPSDVEPGAAAREEPPRDLEARRPEPPRITEPRGIVEPPREAAPRIAIITGPVERRPVAPPPIPPSVLPPVAAVEDGPRGAGPAPAASAAASAPRSAEPATRRPANGVPPAPPGSTEPSPTAALLDAWVRLSRERPLLQVGVMLALALLFGLLFAALFAMAGEGPGRTVTPAADSAVVADSAPGAASTGDDSAPAASGQAGGARPGRAGAAQRPAPPMRTPERTAVRPPEARRPAAAPARTAPTAAPADPATAQVAPAPADTATRQAAVAPLPAAVDSATAAARAAADSAAAARAREIEALREEFARSRARLDSINRTVDSVAPPPAPPAGR